MISKPASSEYHDFYAGYVNQVINEDILSFLQKQNDEVSTFFRQIPEGKINYAYAQGKWTVKQLVRHISDAERVFGYRALTIARKDQTQLPGFDEGDYIASADDSDNVYESLVQEFQVLREANIHMIRNFNDQCFAQIGNANGTPISVRAIIYIMAGHVAHHKKIIEERYL